jgi:ATP-dependent RNA helicase DDX51/DBP6
VQPLQPIPPPKPVSKSAQNPISSALPSWLADPIRISATTTSLFTELGIPEHVSKALKIKGFDHAFAVQVALLPLLLPGDRQHSGDVLISAATGSGKTLGYVLPMISDISRTSVTRLRGLVVVPTRDLVYQAYEICEICATAFSGKGRRRVAIGMACGDASYKQELAHIMRANKTYNPAEYQKRKQRPVSRWNSSDYDTDGDEMFPSENESSSTPLNYITKHMSRVDVLICTPGRLVQHLHNTDGFDLNHVKYLVIDEADRLFNQGYQGWLKDIMAILSKGARRRIKKILLSATMTQDLGILGALNLNSPTMVLLDGGQDGGNGDEKNPQNKFSLPESLQEYYVQLRHRADKPLELLLLMKKENMLDESNAEKRGVLIFTNSNEAALRLGRLIKLMDPDISIGTLTSTMPAVDRKKTLRDFQLKKLSAVVASDLVSRGLDIPSLAHVVNYDFPTTMEKYIHRVGRTARAGKGGKAWTLHTAKEIQVGMRRGGQTVALPNIELETRKRYEVSLAILAKEAGKA